MAGGSGGRGKVRKPRSWVWKYMEQIVVEGKKSSRCMICGTVYETRVTTTLSRHIEERHPEIFNKEKGRTAAPPPSEPSICSQLADQDSPAAASVPVGTQPQSPHCSDSAEKGRSQEILPEGPNEDFVWRGIVTEGVQVDDLIHYFDDDESKLLPIVHTEGRSQEILPEGPNEDFVWRGIVTEGVQVDDLINYFDDDESKLLPIVHTETSLCTSNELINPASCLQSENARIEAQIGAYNAELGKVDGENAVLRACHGELAERLQALCGVLEIFQVAGAPVDIPEIPDPMLRPWQSPFVPQLAATGAMADAFQF